MTVSRLRDIPGIGVDEVGDAADAAADPRFLRLENLDTNLRPPQVALEATHAAIDRDDANSYLPFQGHLALREAACGYVTAATGRSYDPRTQCVSVAGGLNGILNVLPDANPSRRFEPQLVGGADVKRAVELVEVPHDLVAAELARRVRVGSEPPDGFLVPGLLPPGTSP
jgi:hypothetical protein